MEVVKAVRDAGGEDFPIAYRLSGDEYIDGGLTLEETVPFAKRLEEAGVTPMSKGRVTLPLEIGIGAILRPPEEWNPDGEEEDEGLPENVYMIVVQDPDGNFIELIGP